MDLKNKYSENEIVVFFENYEITKLDISRIYRYLEKYTKDNVSDVDDVCDDSSVENEIV